MISNNDNKKDYKIGFLYPWPGSTENGEFEIIRRLQYYCDRNDIQFDLISNNGRLLDKDANFLGNKLVYNEEYDFIISAHYSSRKLVDSFHYHAVWNPTEFLFHKFNNPIGYRKAVKNIFSCDDFLISNSDVVLNRLKTVASHEGFKFAASYLNFFPSSLDMGFKTNITEGFRIFYCGINWDAHNESVEKKWNRFSEMFSILDKENIMDYYGPTIVNGREPWRGYTCYKGQLAFDGIAVINSINKSGVGLSLMSDAHRNSGGLLSSRAYEILAAGALLIADRNGFLEENFGENVLYIDYNSKNPANMARQILEHYEWIKNNLEVANQKARKSQEIWKSKFAFDITLPAIFEKHEDRLRIFAQTYESSGEKEIDVVVCISKYTQDPDVERVFDSFTKQSYSKKHLIIVCDKEQEAQINAIAAIKKCSAITTIVTLETEINTPKGSQLLNTGAILIAGLAKSHAPYVAFLPPGILWKSNHLSLLARALDDDETVMLTYSGTIKVTEDLMHEVLVDEINSLIQVHKIGDYGFKGNLMMRNRFALTIPDWLIGQVNQIPEVCYLFAAIVSDQASYIFKETVFLFSGKDLNYHNITPDEFWRYSDVLEQVLKLKIKKSKNIDQFSYAGIGLFMDSQNKCAAMTMNFLEVEHVVVRVVKNFIQSNWLLRKIYKILNYFKKP